MRPALTVLAGILVLGVTGCGGSGGAEPGAQARPSAVRELKSLDPLKAAFDADAGRSRLLLIFSPT